MGCDFDNPYLTKLFVYFNPRTHVGCDLQSDAYLSTYTQFQSTHPRGVRLSFIICSFVLLLFQSTHPRGVRQALWVAAWILPKFQSTHPRGVRPPAGNSAPSLSDFNPRTHVGCDVEEARRPFVVVDISIHAPTWGATDKRANALYDVKFQSTHPRGVRLNSIL